MNNKKLALSITCVVLICAFAQAQEFSLRSNSRAQLEATTSIRQQSACLSGSDLVQVNLALSVKFTNVGNYPVIVSKNSGIIANEYIAHTEKMAYSKKYEYRMRGDMFDFPFMQQEDSPGHSFRILKPNETYEREMYAWGIYLKYPREYDHYSQAAHFLRIDFLMMDTNFISPDSKWVPWEKSRSRWKKYGDLLFGVTSQPMRIEVPQAGGLNKCQ